MTLLADPSLALLIDVVKGLVFVLFVLCALLLMLVVLLQEGKGGGLGSAFGGAAADAFGVKAGTVNKFTTWLATGFLGLALLYAGLSAQRRSAQHGPAATRPRSNRGRSRPTAGGAGGRTGRAPARCARGCARGCAAGRRHRGRRVARA